MRLVNQKLINPEVRIENTNRCNARCQICPREKMTRKLCTMEMDHFQNLVDQSVLLGADTISIFGYGEPLIDKAISDKVRYCAQKGLSTFLTTNAALLTDECAKQLIDSGLSHIRFSVHGFRENYNKVHRGLSWNRTRKNIFNFVNQNSSTKTSISVIPTNGEPIYRIRAYWESVVDYLEIWRPHNWAGGRSYRGLTVMKRKKTCGRPANGPLQIQANGKMIVCCFDYDGLLEIGDTYKNSIAEILDGKLLKYYKRCHETNLVDHLICGKCDQLNIETESPLLYSNRDETREAGKTSSTKFKLGE